MRYWRSCSCGCVTSVGTSLCRLVLRSSRGCCSQIISTCLTRQIARIPTVPKHFLLQPLMCIIGTLAISNNWSTVVVMLLFSGIGSLLDRQMFQSLFDAVLIWVRACCILQGVRALFEAYDVIGPTLWRLTVGVGTVGFLLVDLIRQKTMPQTTAVTGNPLRVSLILKCKLCTSRKSSQVIANHPDRDSIAC